MDVERTRVRRRFLPGIAVLTALAAGATACTGGDGIGGIGDQKNGSSTAAPAQPGKYRSLPQPCKAVDGKRLRAMLPASDSLTTEQREQLYAGTAESSYDADRHVGCRWNAQTPEAALLLSVTFERVVSYDRAAASDDDKAHQVYVRRLTDAHLPFPGPAAGSSASPGPSPSTSPGTGAPAGTAPGGPEAPQSPPATAPTPSASATGSPELGSRVLDGLGSEGFLDDKLGAAGATAAQNRTVRIVFRTSNVIVTVEYSVQPSAPGKVPPAAETQDKTRQLAEALAERFSE
ncbi:hypothetical protein BX286_3248 [Streptomyces sp. 3211.6]|uniref:DUF3558 domain-containing protein n=1 Tax=Streptomyces sp. 3211.6 TaxID=1938845 RepID=UPI000CC94978|nr:DUF3558 domain-containing protein [Streptomyces sp. 3211.6]RKT05256.1 hypothetical protein BX286_3248 [Streptomyces sp. 3211.6]